MKKKLLALLVLLFFTFNVGLAQKNKNLFGGIEIGSKGIKMSVLDVDNIKKGDYEIKSFWTENVGIAKGISIDGNLAQEDMTIATDVVKNNLTKLKTEFNILEENIFIVGSSGVAMAKNTNELIAKVRIATGKELDFISANQEGKMLMRGLIPAENYDTSVVLDIGGGNTKGGYVDIFNNNNFVFFPVSLNYGSITLTEFINKKTKTNTLSEYVEKHFGFLPELRDQVKTMYNSRPKALEKENIYMSGGAVWAFYTLYHGVAKQNFHEFKLEDVIYYDAIIKNNFKKFEELAKTDKDAERVLKTYSQKHLISASNLFLITLEAIPNINNKKLYFANQGQIAWLVSYIADKSRKVKKIW